MDIRICSFNVKGLASEIKRQQVFKWLNNKFDICFLQETHFTNQKDNWQKQWDGELFLSGNCSNSKGVGIIINSKLSYDVIEHIEPIVGRIQLLRIKMQNNTNLKCNKTVNSIIESHDVHDIWRIFNPSNKQNT